MTQTTRQRAQTLYHTIKQTRDEAQCLAAIESLILRERAEAVAEERARCDAIIQAARMWEIDTDLRTLSHHICSGSDAIRARPTPEQENTDAADKSER